MPSKQGTWTVGLLAAGFPIALISTFMMDVWGEDDCENPMRLRIACTVSLAVGIAGISAYFLESAQPMAWGFVIGALAAIIILPRFK
jgi:hypothetical protein